MKKNLHILYINLLCANIALCANPDTQIATNDGNVLTEINQSQDQPHSSLVHQVRTIYAHRIEVIQQILNLYDDHKKVTATLKSAIDWMQYQQIYSQASCFNGDQDTVETKDLTTDDNKLIKAYGPIVDEAFGYAHDKDFGCIAEYKDKLKKGDLIRLEMAEINAFAQQYIEFLNFLMQERSELNLSDNNEQEKIAYFIHDIKELHNLMIDQLSISSINDENAEQVYHAIGSHVQKDIESYKEKNDEMHELFNAVKKNRSQSYIDRNITQFVLHYLKLRAENILKMIEQEPVSQLRID